MPGAITRSGPGGRIGVFVFIFASCRSESRPLLRCWGRGRSCPSRDWRCWCCTWRFATSIAMLPITNCIAIDGDRVEVESFEGGRRRHHEFNRQWARLVVDRGRRARRVAFPRARAGNRAFRRSRAAARDRARTGAAHARPLKQNKTGSRGEASMVSKWVRWPVAAAAWLVAGTAAANRYNLQEPQSEIARQIYDLHTLIMWIIVGIFVVVFGAMTYAIVMHRKSVGHKAEQFHENTTVEISLDDHSVHHPDRHGVAGDPKTIISMKDTSHRRHHHQGDRLPVEVGLRLPAGRHQLLQHARHAARPDRGLRAQGHEQGRALPRSRWTTRWSCPIGKKVRIITTANDVIHAWWVPALGIKQDAIPGFVRDTWFKADNPGHLSRAVRRALRQGPRLHADRGGSGGPREVRGVGRRAEENDGREAPMTRARLGRWTS